MIYLGADHRGFELKEKIKKWLVEWSYQYEDMGALEFNKDDDYVDFVSKVGAKVSEDPENNKGIVLGMSGQGEAMVANKFKGVRAAVFYGPSYPKKGFKRWLLVLGGDANVAEGIYDDKLKEVINLSREHNDANVLSLGASFLHDRAAKHFVKLWLETKFSGEERHVRRINKMKEFEK
ncbi:MAG: RpiB/LacA/LacB family sugar-phosphate isomerase [bacterium]|nr:RpiB/LacA/LacB family sugar-phosphate isomerase [bacterium]